MRPRPINCKADLIAYLREHAPSPACARAMADGRVTVLGGFAPPGGLPYRAVHVKAKHGQQWDIALVVDEDNYQYLVRVLDDVGWEHWIGHRKGTDPLVDGDHPFDFSCARVMARWQKGLPHGTTPTATRSDVRGSGRSVPAAEARH